MSTPTCAARAPRVPGPELIDVKVGYGAKIPVYRRTACPVDVRLDEGHVRQPRRYRSGARPAARPATSIERADPGRPPGPGAAFSQDRRRSQAARLDPCGAQSRHGKLGHRSSATPGSLRSSPGSNRPAEQTSGGERLARPPADHTPPGRAPRPSRLKAVQSNVPQGATGTPVVDGGCLRYDSARLCPVARISCRSSSGVGPGGTWTTVSLQ